ncbi:nuclear transport factor 2 family protein [Sphingopyxis sp. KK2]|uniref:nuclear transport factor 2 family protein n=1 Tax=Sphingopyxis sp. KK2 TaxID=1855727 RepID=UPI00097E64F2|nr:nuclear transport factor 2 family protein [Sphingopyxis sp. KK2]
MSFDGPSQDRLALRDLLDAYADAVCRRDGDAWAATWTEDALWSLPGVGVVEGRANIAETWRVAMRSFPEIHFRAWPGSIRIDGERARMRSYTEERYLRDDTLHRTLGVYEDVCRSVGGRWLFAERRFQPLPRLSIEEASA